MSVHFPGGWQISRATDFDKHNPECSYRIAHGGFICDCEVLTEHPEYKSKTFYGENGRVIREAEKADA